MLKDIISAKYISGYKIKVRFEDGRTGIVDLSKSMNEGVLKKLKDINYFKKFYVNKELGTICWPDGQDIAPETIYKKLAA